MSKKYKYVYLTDGTGKTSKCKIKGTFTKDGKEYISYNYPNYKSGNKFQDTLWKLGILSSGRFALVDNAGCWVSWNRDHLNLWNPLSWLLLLFSIVLTFILYGWYEVKDSFSDKGLFLGEMYGPYFHYKYENVKFE